MNVNCEGKVLVEEMFPFVGGKCFLNLWGDGVEEGQHVICFRRGVCRLLCCATVRYATSGQFLYGEVGGGGGGVGKVRLGGAGGLVWRTGEAEAGRSGMRFSISCLLCPVSHPVQRTSVMFTAHS